MNSIPPSCLIIPWTLRPNTRLSVGLTEIGERTQAHVEGLLAWLDVPEITDIVLAKNCQQPMKEDVLIKLAKNCGKRLEVLTVPCPPQVQTRGKGYGEGALLDAVLPQSRLLASADSFFKCTGKLFAPDFLSLYQPSFRAGFFCGSRPTHARVLLPSAVFRSSICVQMLFFLRQSLRVPWNVVAYSHDQQVDTRIYWVQKVFYQQHLAQSYRRVCEPLGYNLEDAVYQDIEQIRNIFYLDKSPLIFGMSGTLATMAATFDPKITDLAKTLAEELLCGATATKIA